MRWWSTASIRVRLTAWYSGVLTLMLIVYASATFLAVRHEFYEQLEQEGHVEDAHPQLTAEQRVDQQLGEILVVLVLGLINMMRGGSGNTSPKLMRLRVLLQFVAIVIIMFTIWVMAR